jgi:hypothetical protein
MRTDHFKRLLRSWVLFSIVIVAAAGCTRQNEPAERTGPLVADRPLSPTAFYAAIEVKRRPAVLKANETAAFSVSVKNIGDEVWPAKELPGGQYAIHLAYHWLNKRYRVEVFDGQRTALPRDVYPGDEVRLEAAVTAPAKPGRYVLEFDMVQEHVSWFNPMGSQSTMVDIEVVR